MADNQKPRREWQRHFLINKRAHALRCVMADPKLGGPAKTAFYGLCLVFDEATMSAEISQKPLARLVGMSAKRAGIATHALERAGYIDIIDNGSKGNVFTYVGPYDSFEIVGSKASSQTNASVGSKASSQKSESDRAKTESDIAMSENLSGRFRPFVRTVSTPHYRRQSISRQRAASGGRAVVYSGGD